MIDVFHGKIKPSCSFYRVLVPVFVCKLSRLLAEQTDDCAVVLCFNGGKPGCSLCCVLLLGAAEGKSLSLSADVSDILHSIVDVKLSYIQLI